MTCDHCKAQFYPHQTSVGRFCSNSCQQAFITAEKDLRFLAGQPGVFQSSKSLRKAIARRDGYRCSCCGIDRWRGEEITLEVEHKDGNSNNESPSNLCLICPNCHALTPTYKGKNRGNGRHYRRERYRAGLSF